MDPGAATVLLGSGDVSADVPALGLVDATVDGGEVAGLAQPARRVRHISDDATVLGIRSTSVIMTRWVVCCYGVLLARQPRWRVGGWVSVAYWTIVRHAIE